MCAAQLQEQPQEQLERELKEHKAQDAQATNQTRERRQTRNEQEACGTNVMRAGLPGKKENETNATDTMTNQQDRGGNHNKRRHITRQATRACDTTAKEVRPDPTRKHKTSEPTGNKPTVQRNRQPSTTKRNKRPAAQMSCRGPSPEKRETKRKTKTQKSRNTEHKRHLPFVPTGLLGNHKDQRRVAITKKLGTKTSKNGKQTKPEKPSFLEK
jgi:hypothetical protein